MELYDPEFPCDSDVLDLSNNDKNDVENDSLNATRISSEDFSQIELSSIELPAAKDETNRGHLTESIGSSRSKTKAAEEFSTSENEFHSFELDSNSVAGNSLNRIDDADGEDLDDETNYRDELKRLTGGRSAKGSELKAGKEVPLEMYLGPSVGFRVDLMINKGRKSNVESIARRRHKLNDTDLFERLSPEPHGKSKIKGKRADASRNGNKLDIRLPKLGSGSAETGSDSREGNEPQRTETSFEQDKEAHQNLEKSPQKRQPSSPIFSSLPQSVKAKPMGDHRSTETHSPQKSRSIESEKENVDSRRRKHNEPSSDTKKSTSRVESEREICERDGRNGSPSVKSSHRDSHLNEKDSREKRHGKDDRENTQHAKDQEKKHSRKESGSKGRGRGHVKETDSTSDIESAPSRKKCRSSRSPSQGRKKMYSKKSKSNSPKRRRNRSQSRDNRIVRRSRSRTRDQERLQEKKSETKSKHGVRHLADPRLEQATDKHRRHRSRSKSPAQDIESKRRKEQSRLSDFRESGFFCESWNYEARSSKNHKTHTRQSAAKDLLDTGTNLFEACMRTRYEKRLSNEDPWRSRPRHDGIDNSKSLSRDYCQAAGVEYITVSDSDEGIVWSDNDDNYGNYSKLTTQTNSSKKRKYEDIYSTRGLQTNDNRAPVKILKKKKKRHKKEKSLSPSEILAINLKRKEKARKRENLKITKSVSRSSLEPGEIDERSSVSSNDNIVESVLPSKRTVSLLSEDDGRRPPGDKIPIQIHVITSHGGDSREKEDTVKDCHENVADVMLKTEEEAECGEKDLEKQCPKSREESRKPLDLSDKELPGDAAISSDSSSARDGRADQTLKEIRKLLSKVESLGSREEQTCETANSLKSGMKANAEENSIVAEVGLEAKEPGMGPQFSKQEDDISSPVSQTVSSLREPFSIPAKEKDKETEMSSAKSIALSQPSFYQIKKKIQPEQSVLKLDNSKAQKQPGSLSGSSWKSPPLKSKEEEDEEEPKLLESPAMSPVNQDLRSATHQMPALVATNFPTLLTTTVSGSCSFGTSLPAASEEPPLPSPVPDQRSGKAGLQSSNAPVLTNPFTLNQNAIMDFLTPLQNPVLPSLSSLMHSTASVPITTTTDASLSKFLAAITPTVTPITSQKLIDNLLKASSATLPELSAKSQALKSVHSDDQFSSLLNMQKKLSDLSQISNVASHSSAPISQKLVQDIFKAVLPNISGVPDISTLCPQPTDIPCSLSDDDCMNEASMLDYRSPSFSPPSLPDRSSPGRNSDMLLPSQETKSKGHRAKAKVDTLKSDDLVKEKMSKTDIQKRVVEHVKSVIRPFYSKGRINKDEYKEIMRKTVPKICHSKTQDFSKTRITIYVEAYARKVMATRKYNAKKKDQE